MDLRGDLRGDLVSFWAQPEKDRRVRCWALRGELRRKAGMRLLEELFFAGAGAGAEDPEAPAGANWANEVSGCRVGDGWGAATGGGAMMGASGAWVVTAETARVLVEAPPPPPPLPLPLLLFAVPPLALPPPDGGDG